MCTLKYNLGPSWQVTWSKSIEQWAEKSLWPLQYDGTLQVKSFIPYGQVAYRHEETVFISFGKFHCEWVGEGPVPLEALQVLTFVGPPKWEKCHIFLGWTIYRFLCSFRHLSYCETFFLVVLGKLLWVWYNPVKGWTHFTKFSKISLEKVKNSFGQIFQHHWILRLETFDSAQ